MHPHAHTPHLDRDNLQITVHRDSVADLQCADGAVIRLKRMTLYRSTNCRTMGLDHPSW